MEKETKESLDKLFSIIGSKRDFMKEVSVYPSYKKGPLEISVYELADLAGNHMFDDNYKKFNLSKRQGQMTREYLQENSIENSINELYLSYPDIFSGEPKWKIDSGLIESYVPMYEENEINLLN